MLKDKKALLWIYENSKSQLLHIVILIFSNSLFASCGVLLALASRGVIDGAAAGEKTTLVKQSLWLFAVFLLQFILRIFCRSLETCVQGKLEVGYKHKLFGELLQKDYASVSRYHSGELMNRLTGDIAIVSEGITTIVPVFACFLTKLFGAVAVLYIIDPTFAIIFAVIGLMLLFTTKYFREKLKHLHKNVQEKDGLMRSFMQEILENLVVVKTFAAEHEIKARLDGCGQEYYRAKIRKNTISILANSGFSFTFSIGYLYTLIWSAVGLMAQTISFGTLTALLQLAGQVQAPIAGLSGLLPKIYGVIASAERLMELEGLPGEPEINKHVLDVAEVYSKMRSINLKDVSFRYGRNMVLNRANLILEKGGFAAVYGPSGIGKSTLLMLLLGILVPEEGNICIELNTGENIPVDRNTRKIFAYVPQGNLLLSGTVRENISFSNLMATDEEIMAAAKVSCAEEFISKLPRGLDTVIGERGFGLSEGQVQRLAIARAVLSGAPVLIFDEATSALDEATEKILLQNIKQMTNKTCIIVSHKKAAFDLCNKEIYIENGALGIIEKGNRIEFSGY